MKTLKVLLQDVVSGLKSWAGSTFAQDSNTVHKSGNETIDGTKTFSAPQCYSSNAILFNSSVLPTQGQVPSANINPLRQYIGYGTSYPNSIFIHDTEMRTNGRNHYRWTVYSDDHSANAAMWLVYNPDSEYLRYLNLKCSCVPDANDTYHLGTPDYKWKSFNGLNPGALSFPNLEYSNSNKWIDIASSITNTAGVDNWYYPAVDGWVFIIASGGAAPDLSVLVFVGSGLNFISGAIPAAESSTGARWCQCLAPAGSRVRIRFNKGSTSCSIEKALFIPCQGNV